MSGGRGKSILNRNSSPVKVVAESGDMDHDEVGGVNKDPLGCPSVLSSNNIDLLAPSVVLHNLPIFIFINLPQAAQMQILAPANTLPPSASSFSSIHPNRNVSATGLIPNTRSTPFRTLADEDKWFEEASKQRVQNEVLCIWDWFNEDEQLWLWLRSNPGLNHGVCWQFPSTTACHSLVCSNGEFNPDDSGLVSLIHINSLKEMTPKVIDEVNSIEVANGRGPGGGEGDAEGVEAGTILMLVESNK
ncbi:hypothetical protein PILCRDRAFT_9785 [Piloderma croceum F 1598]|uniref:Uncharacterized protein n=1 Tax=Piloderma croceum (strain F 1598) TaxID=765440 RepID=A0A0C3FL83_PILCF|nr:hypothetical protein PILCRDRAFT_9785 [Piloderma croceum F 1598]